MLRPRHRLDAPGGGVLFPPLSHLPRSSHGIYLHPPPCPRFSSDSINNHEPVNRHGFIDGASHVCDMRNSTPLNSAPSDHGGVLKTLRRRLTPPCWLPLPEYVCAPPFASRITMWLCGSTPFGRFTQIAGRNRVGSGFTGRRTTASIDRTLGSAASCNALQLRIATPLYEIS